MAYTLDFCLSLGTARTGLTDLRAQLYTAAAGVVVPVGSAISAGFVELAAGSGCYHWHCATIPDSHRGGVYFYSAATPATLLGACALNPEEAENLDAKISSVAASVWAAVTRTLTADTNINYPSAATIAAAVWNRLTSALTTVGSIGKALADLLAVFNASTRTLTMTAAEVVEAIDGDTLNITIGATYKATLTGLTIASNWSKIYLTVKTRSSDADSAAVVQVQESVAGTGDGLLRLNGAAVSAGSTSGGALTVSQAGGTVAITLTDETTLQLVAGYGLAYDVKEVRADGESYALTSGEWNNVETPTKAVS